MTEEQAKPWIGKSVTLVECKAHPELVGHTGRIIASQWGPFGWCLVLVLDGKPKTIEFLCRDDQVAELKTVAT